MKRFLLLVFILFLFVAEGCIQSTKPQVLYTVDNRCALPPLEKRFTYSWEGSNLTINHTLFYPCCAKITLKWRQEGDTLVIEEWNEGEICKCMGFYYLHITVVNPPKKVVVRGIYSDALPNSSIKEYVIAST